jgi:hypothetical protein
MELEEFKKQIRGGIEWAKQQGIIPMRGLWGVWFDANKWQLTMEKSMCCCPLGALLLRDQPSKPYFETNQHRTNIQAISEHLGVTIELLQCFLHGVDDNIPPDSDEEATQWWNFGVVIRAEIN